MNVYHVKRTDCVDWDESDAWMVRAHDADDAVQVIWDEWGEGAAYRLGQPGSLEVFRSRVAVTELTDDGERGIVLESFTSA